LVWVDARDGVRECVGHPHRAVADGDPVRPGDAFSAQRTDRDLLQNTTTPRVEPQERIVGAAGHPDRTLTERDPVGRARRAEIEPEHARAGSQRRDLLAQIVRPDGLTVGGNRARRRRSEGVAFVAHAHRQVRRPVRLAIDAGDRSFPADRVRGPDRIVADGELVRDACQAQGGDGAPACGVDPGDGSSGRVRNPDGALVDGDRSRPAADGDARDDGVGIRIDHRHGVGRNRAEARLLGAATRFQQRCARSSGQRNQPAGHEHHGSTAAVSKPGDACQPLTR
jgi:hypothetical protein